MQCQMRFANYNNRKQKHCTGDKKIQIEGTICTKEITKVNELYAAHYWKFKNLDRVNIGAKSLYTAVLLILLLLS